LIQSWNVCKVIIPPTLPRIKICLINLRNYFTLITFV
jgi:hypothetical protein